MLVDLHAHYPMHLVPADEGGAHEPMRRWRSERFRGRVVDLISRFANYEGPDNTPGVTTDLLREGGVGVALSVLYKPFDEMDFERSYGAPPQRRYFDDLVDQIGVVERDVAEQDGITVAHTPAELGAAIEAGQIALVHAVEGGFHLGPAEDVAANVHALAERGVAYITLAHLFWREVATNAPAIPFLPDRLYRLLFRQPQDEPIAPAGRALVDAMLAERMLIDVTHMSARALDALFALLDERDPERRVPVIATHMACRLGKLEYCFDDTTVERVAERGGVLGVILCEHYVKDGLQRRAPRSLEDSCRLLFAHVDRIREVTGSFDNVGIGSDLDGYIKPALPGLKHEGRMRALQDALRERYGAEAAEAIASGNALRVLRSYWRS